MHSQKFVQFSSMEGDMEGDMEMSVAEKIRSNVEAHGIQYAASIARKQRIPFDTFYFVIFGKYPTK